MTKKKTSLSKDEVVDLQERILKIIFPISKTNDSTKAESNFLFKAKKSSFSRTLPPYYFVYFLFVNLLQFKDIGRFEKIAWSIPIDFKGKAFLIEHRKFGLGIFVNDLEEDEKDAEEIAKRINKAVKVATPYFEHLANEAVQTSKINVQNKSIEFLQRFDFFLSEYKKMENATREAKEKGPIKIQHKGSIEYNYSDYNNCYQKCKFLAISTIESFFSWSEHIFIHLSIIQGFIKTGKEVAELSSSDWGEKYKSAIGLSSKLDKHYYDKLKIIKEEIRNFVAHGSFGKNHDALLFHSGAGAVPVTFQEEKKNLIFSFEKEFVNLTYADSITIINNFITYLWQERFPVEKLYIQDTTLPLILTHVEDGAYKKATESKESMDSFIEYLSYIFDNACNMDF